MHSSSPPPLTCPGCGSAFAIDQVDARAHYVCLRCGQTVGASTRGPTRYLYAGRSQGMTGTDEAPRPQASRDATWAEEPADADAARPERVGRYVVVDEIGRGGMGVVYRAWDEELHRFVALKSLLQGRLAGPDRTERFIREARSAARLDHPGIVEVYDIGQHEGQVYFAMAWVSGPTLADVVEEVGPLPFDEAARLMGEVARALHHAHTKGLAHRDIKPPNILVEADGRPRVTDFGLVHDLANVRLTRTGQIMGTPAYMAPEQAMGDVHADWLKVDIYAMGAVLFFLLTGRPPFVSDGGAGKLLVTVMSGEVPPPSRFRERVPADLDLICQRATAREPEARYDTALALAEDLVRFQRGHPILARPFSPVYRARLFVRRNRAVLRTLALVLLGLAAVGMSLLVARSVNRAREVAVRERAAAAKLVPLRARIAALRDEGLNDQAEAAFLAFANAEEHQGTRAVSDAWLGRARDLVEAGEHGEATLAYGRVYAAPTTWDQQVDALRGLIAELVRRRAWSRAAVALRKLEALGGTTDAHRRMAAQTAIARRDLAAAEEAWAHVAGDVLDARPLMRRLLHGAALPDLARIEDQADLDGDGVLELLTRDLETVRSLRVFRAGWPVTLVATLPRSGSHPQVRSAPLDGRSLVWAALGDREATEVFALEDGALRLWSTVEGLRAHAVVAADLDGDGADETYVGAGPYARRLVRIARDGDRLVRTVVDPRLDAAESDFRDLLALDVDDDGDDELVVAHGAWRAYDVRVLDHGPDGIHTVARARLGLVERLARLDDPQGRARLVAAKTSSSPSPAPPHPDAAPAALVVLDPQTLQTLQRLPFDATSVTGSEHAFLWVADLDGDGVDEVAVGLESGESQRTLVYRQGGEGLLEPLELAGVLAQGAVDLDGDGAAELLATVDGAWLALGIDEAPLPALAPYASAAQPPPPGLVGTPREAWRRAEELVDMGLLEEGARAHQLLAARLSGTPSEVGARRRAANLWTAAGRGPQAIRTLRELATIAQDEAPAILDEATTAAMGLGDYAGARQTNAELLAHPHSDDEAIARARARGAWLDALLGPPALTLDFTQRPPPALSVIHDDLVRWDPRRGVLVVDTHGELETPLAQVVLERHDGPDAVLGFDVDLAADRLEWGSRFTVELRPRGGRGHGLAMHAGGGGGRLTRSVQWLEEGRMATAWSRTTTQADGRWPLSYHLRILPAEGRILHWFTDEQGAVIQHRSRPIDTPDDAAWVLELASDTYANLEMAAVARATVSRLALTGFDPVPAPPVAPSGVAGVLADPGAPGAAVALRAAMDRDPDATGRLRRAVRFRPGEVLPLLREALPAGQVFTLVHQAWEVTLRMHQTGAEITTLLADGLPGLAAWRPASDAERTLRADLLVRRAEARWSRGLADRARADLDLVLGDPTTPASLRLDALVRAVDIAASTQHLDEAFALATRAVDESLTPELTRDALRALPSLEGAERRPGWDALLEAR